MEHSSDTTLSDVDVLLIACLAQVDALFWPLRDPRHPAWPAIWATRWAYPHRGLPWRGGGSKEAERALASAARQGLIARQRGRAKTVGVALTRPGLERAWQRIGLRRDSDTVVARYIESMAVAGTWIPETTFDVDRNVTAGAHLPALVTGLVESNCTVHGHVAYRLTSKPPVAPVCSDPWPDPDPTALALYETAFVEALTQRQSLHSDAGGTMREIGEIPLSYAAFARTAKP